MPAIALLSISSTPSRLPGLGTQCLPVLSFHAIDAAKQELVPLPWGPERKVPPMLQQASGERNDNAAQSGNARRRSSASSQQQQDQANTSNAASGRNSKPGPQAMGRTLTAEQAKAREQALAKSKLTRAHVTLPFADALGAHLLTALPQKAGGNVIVWSETSVLIVTPPHTSDGADANEDVKSPESSGKRRKSSMSSTAAPASGVRRMSAASQGAKASAGATTSPDAAMLASSPSASANEHGKRRRSSVKTGMPTAPVEAMSLDEPVSGSAKSGFAGLEILRLSLPRPIQVSAATVAGNGDAAVEIDASGTRATVHVLFSTAAGALNDLEVTLSRQSQQEAWQPSNLRATRVGQVPRASGPQSLTYLGEGFVHVASASGDSVVVQIQGSGDDDAPSSKGGDAEMVSPPTSPIQVRRRGSSMAGGGISSASAVASAQTTSLKDLPASGFSLSAVHTFPSLAPVLDFIVDGDANASAGGAQPRIITASGTGPDGALGVVKTGVAQQAIGALGVADVRKVWTITSPADTAALFVCGFAEETRILKLTSEGVEDVDAQVAGGALSKSRTIEAAALPGDSSWVHISESGVTVLDTNTGAISQAWKAAAGSDSRTSRIVAASVDGSSGLVALNSGHVVMLQLSTNGIQVISESNMPHEVSALHLSKGIAAIGQWTTNTVKLFLVSPKGFEDATPNSMGVDGEGLGSLPRSCLIHSFTRSDQNAAPAKLHLLVGLATGAVVSYVLSLPTADSFSRSIGLYERKVSALGRKPVYLTPFLTNQGKHAVFAANGDAPTVLWAEATGRMTCSAFTDAHVVDAAPLAIPGAESALVTAEPTSLTISTVGEIGQVDITKLHLGLDNPSALCGIGPDERGLHKHLVVLTNPFKPEGSATREQRPAKVLLFDALNLEPVEEIELETNERANCVSSVELDGREHLVVGTGFVKADETETTDGRVLGFLLEDSSDGKATRQVFERHVNGNVYAVAGAAGKLVCAVNSEVISFGYRDAGPSSADDMDEDEGHARALVPLSKWGCAFVACTLSSSVAQPNRVVVGDALRSLCVLEVEGQRGKISEIARDCDPFWTTACCTLDNASQTYIGADISFNVYTSQRAKLSAETRRRMQRDEERRKDRAERGDETAAVASSNNPPLPPADEDWSHVMERRGAWHYGDLINRLREATLVSREMSSLTSKLSSGAPAIDPRLVFATSSGAVGIISHLDEATGKVLSEVERNLQSVLPPVGNIQYNDWRTLRTDHRTSAPAGFIDGDFIQRYAEDLDAGARGSVLAGPRGEFEKVSATAGEVDELVECLGRLC